MEDTVSSFPLGVLNAWRASIGKITREKYLNQYKVTLVRPDGSTILAR